MSAIVIPTLMIAESSLNISLQSVPPIYVSGLKLKTNSAISLTVLTWFGWKCQKVTEGLLFPGTFLSILVGSKETDQTNSNSMLFLPQSWTTYIQIIRDNTNSYLIMSHYLFFHRFLDDIYLQGLTFILAFWTLTC